MSVNCDHCGKVITTDDHYSLTVIEITDGGGARRGKVDFDLCKDSFAELLGGKLSKFRRAEQ